MVDYWVRNNVITPYRAATGSGTFREWSDVDVFVVRALATCSRALGQTSRGVMDAVAEAASEMAERVNFDELNGPFVLHVTMSTDMDLTLRVPACRPVPTPFEDS